MQLIKLLSPASYKPYENVINKARHILKSPKMLKKIKKNVATVNANKLLIIVIFTENLSCIYPKRMLPLMDPTPTPIIARRAN
jgi:type IV secretory pathway VirB4 component